MKEKKTVVVIGGGLGGLSAAVSLAQNGFDVSLYEKNHHLGGKLNRLETNGFGFDLGPSILTMPQIFEKLFTGSNRDMADYVAIRRLPLEWRSFFLTAPRSISMAILHVWQRKTRTCRKKTWPSTKTFWTMRKRFMQSQKKAILRKA